MLGNRGLSRIARAITEGQHYKALLNMWRYYPRFMENLWRYLTGYGAYPYEIEVRTPIGITKAMLYSHHDLLTVNEIFCREDYYASADTQVVVDLGSNIGISALYFLTRNRTSRCRLLEPDPKNTSRLRRNLAGFQERYELCECAVSSESGVVSFGVEPTGRYGGIGVNTGEYIRVQCREANEVLDEVLASEEVVDILKIDTEGAELGIVGCIRRPNLERIKRIFLEAHPRHSLHPEIFRQVQYGSVCRLTNRSLCG
jgi:FkbM family methyltransferase